MRGYGNCAGEAFLELFCFNFKNLKSPIWIHRRRISYTNPEYTFFM